MRLTLHLRTALVLLNACLAGGDSGKITVGLSDGKANLRACTVHELLPLACQSKSSEWTDEYVDEPVYDCSCATMKGRYFCPTQGDAPYLKWEPRAVSKGVCRSKSRAEMVGAPLPPNTKILLYGNSHLRQVVEGIMCMFETDLTAKRVTLGADRVETTVPRDMQCRACYSIENPDEVSPLEQKLLDHGCIAEGDNCRCGDSQGEFKFDNGAVVHFQFSHLEEHKDLTDARQNHGMDTLSSYDAVFMNPGNNPSIGPRKAVEMALEVEAAGAQAFWLSSYNGDGRISSWSKGQRDRLFQSGAEYVDIECMARGMRSWTRGAVEGVDDGHFCMPGPSDEIGLLLVKIVWAMVESRM